KDSIARVVLDGIRAGVLYVLDHAGILFDALLSGARVTVRFGDGEGRGLGPMGDAGVVGDPRLLRDRGGDALVHDARTSHAGRYFLRIEPKSRRVHAFAGTY